MKDSTIIGLIYNVDKPKFFTNSKALRKWFEVNHAKTDSLWIEMYRKGFGEGLTQKEAVDQALCFGWIYSIVKNYSESTYVMKFIRRKEGSSWSKKNRLRLKELEKMGLVSQAGLMALKKRDKSKSEERLPQFTRQELKKFKSQKKAWTFFSGQTKSYQKYTTQWVVSAKRDETRKKRLSELIEDSSNESKLKRIVQATEKYQRRFEPGQTPIEEAKNIGPASGADLRSVGINTVEKLKNLGWEEAFRKLCEVHPHRLNLNMATSLAGAVTETDWKKVDPGLKREAKFLIQEISSEFRLQMRVKY